MTDTHTLLALKPTSIPLSEPFLEDQCPDLPPDPVIKEWLYLRVTSNHRQCASLFEPIAFQIQIPAQISNDGRLVTLQYHGNHYLTINSFLRSTNLASFLMGKLHVSAHLRSSYFGRLERAAILLQSTFISTDRVALTN